MCSEDEKCIYYVGFYDQVNSKYKRNYVLSAITKMDYIANAIVRTGNKVEIISSSWLIEHSYNFIKGDREKICENVYLTRMPSFGVKTKIGRALRVYFTLFALFIRLLHVKKDETVLVYHSPWLYFPVKIAKKIKRFRLIIEIEEIYAYAFNLNKNVLKKELDIIKKADAWIVVNDLIADLFNLNESKVLVCYGAYRINDNLSELMNFDDEKIHLVYAGSISGYNGGAQNAIQAARFLSEKYMLHILGSVDDKYLMYLLNEIEDVNSFSECKVKYEGCMTGNEYISFMKSCDIGLNPQNWGDYMLYAYPSKTLSYFCFGLNVVTSPLKTLYVSKLNDYFNYFKEENPQSIADAIINVNLLPKSSIRNKIEELDNDFVAKINRLLFV